MDANQVRDAMVTAAARVLSRLQAQACNVDAEDQWKFYGEEFKADAAMALEAALNTSDLERDAARYRWLREQHEGVTPLEMDADGFPIPQEPTAEAFTVFRPVGGSLDPVPCMPGELDAAIDAAMLAARAK